MKFFVSKTINKVSTREFREFDSWLDAETTIQKEIPDIKHDFLRCTCHYFKNNGINEIKAITMKYDDFHHEDGAQIIDPVVFKKCYGYDVAIA